MAAAGPIASTELAARALELPGSPCRTSILRPYAKPSHIREAVQNVDTAVEQIFEIFRHQSDYEFHLGADQAEVTMQIQIRGLLEMLLESEAPRFQGLLHAELQSQERRMRENALRSREAFLRQAAHAPLNSGRGVALKEAHRSGNSFPPGPPASGMQTGLLMFKENEDPSPRRGKAAEGAGKEDSAECSVAEQQPETEALTARQRLLKFREHLLAEESKHSQLRKRVEWSDGLTKRLVETIEEQKCMIGELCELAGIGQAFHGAPRALADGAG